MRRSKLTPEERHLLNTHPMRKRVIKPLPIEDMKPVRGKRKPEPRTPGYDGSFEVGARVVDDPYEPGNKITVPANVRHDPLLRMRAANEIDEWEYEAGDRFRTYIEKAGGSGAPCADWTRPFVDKSISFKEPALTQLQATQQLGRAHALLGWLNYRLLRSVIFDGLNGSLIAQARGNIHDRKHIKANVRESLKQLAILWRIGSWKEQSNKHADMVAYLNEIPTWGHEEREINIEYAEPKRKRA